MKPLLFILYLLFVVSTYGQKIPIMQKKATGRELHINVYSALQKKIPKLIASQFVADIEFIPLETTDDCLLGETFTNIIITDSDIIVYDHNGCYRFDRQGKFKNRIGTKGNGPGEYINTLSIMADTINQWIYMSDYMQRKYVKYDFSGKYLGDIVMGSLIGFESYLFKPMFFLMKESFYQFAAKEDRFSIKFISEKDKKFVSQMRCEHKGDIPKKLTCDPLIYDLMGDLYMNDYWCDTIYKVVNPFLLESHIILDKGKFEYSNTYSDYDLKIHKKGQNVLSIEALHETERYFMLSSNQGNIVVDKKNKQTFVGKYHVEGACIEDDLYGSPGIKAYKLFSLAQGNELYTFYHAHEFIENGKGKHSITDTRYDAYRKMVDGLKEDDNPVIMIVKLKR